MHKEIRALSEAIGSIYDAAVNPDLWPLALKTICRHMNSASGTINYHDISKNTALIAHEHGTDPRFSRLYVEQYADKNPLVGAIFVQAVGDPKRICDLIPYDAYRSSALYNEWCVPQRYEDLIGACIYRDATRVGALAAVRRTEEGMFSDEDTDVFAIISSHVHRALTISNHLYLRKADTNIFRALIEKLSTAVFLIDASGWLLFKNEAASLLIAEGAGRVANHRLSLNGIETSDIIEGVAKFHFYETSVRMGASASPLSLSAVSVNVDSRARTEHIAVFLASPSGGPRPSKAFLKSAYRLTVSEIRVVLSLCDGLSPADIASKADVSIATVRSQIASIREKTGARNQTDLIRLLAAAQAPTRAR